MTDAPTTSSTGRPGPALVKWEAVALAACLVLLLGVHWSLVSHDPILKRDDQALLAPLAQLSSLWDYPRLLLEGRVLDVQPVRDLSFLVDLWIGRHLGLHTFHLTNLVIWCGTVLLLRALLARLVSNRAVVVAAVALFGLHPVFVNSVGWVSARKHLLSCFFILAATVVVVRAVPGRTTGTDPVTRRPCRLAASTGLALVTLFGLSIASQPITILWPLWAAFHLALGGREAIRRFAWPLAGCAVLAVLGAAANLWYYAGPYLQAGGTKFVEDSGFYGVRALAHGRYFFNLILPLRLAVDYYPGSPWNLVGLLALPLVGGLLLKSVPRRALLSWFAFYLAPLAVVTVRLTNIFVSDTYLLVPGVGLCCLLALAADTRVRSVTPAGDRALAAASVGLVALFALLAAREASAWQSNAALWAHAYEVEPTPNVLARHASHLIQQGRARESLAVALRLHDWSPGHPEAARTLGRAVLAVEDLAVEQKLRLLEQNATEDPWHHYFVAWAFAGGGDYGRAWTSMERALAHPERFAGELPIVVAEGVFLCRRSGTAPCEGSAERARANALWDEVVYRRRLDSLR